MAQAIERAAAAVSSCKEVLRSETAPFIQIRKKVQALWVTVWNPTALSDAPDTGEIRCLLS